MMRAEVVAATFGCTVEQALAGYARSLATLRDMLERARAVAPRKYRGYDVATLERRVAEFEAFARGDA